MTAATRIGTLSTVPRTKDQLRASFTRAYYGKMYDSRWQSILWSLKSFACREPKSIRWLLRSLNEYFIGHARRLMEEKYNQGYQSGYDRGYEEARRAYYGRFKENS